MKKFKYLFLVVVAAISVLSLTSCKEDDPQNVYVPTYNYRAVVLSATGGNITPSRVNTLKKGVTSMSHMTEAQAYEYWKITVDSYLSRYADGFKVAEEIENNKGVVIDEVAFVGTLILKLGFQNEEGETLEIATYEMTENSCKLISVEKAIYYKATVVSLEGENNLSEANRQAFLERYQYCSALNVEDAVAYFDEFIESLANEYEKGIKTADRVLDPNTGLMKNVPFEGTLIVNVELKDASGSVVKKATLTITRTDCTVS